MGDCTGHYRIRSVCSSSTKIPSIKPRLILDRNSLNVKLGHRRVCLPLTCDNFIPPWPFRDFLGNAFHNVITLTSKYRNSNGQSQNREDNPQTDHFQLRSIKPPALMVLIAATTLEQKEKEDRQMRLHYNQRVGPARRENTGDIPK